MKKCISMMMIAAMAMIATSCDLDDKFDGKDDDKETIDGVKYVGDLTVSIDGIVMGGVAQDYEKTQENVIFYVDADEDDADVMMPKVSFMVGMMPELDMALEDISLISANTYFSQSATMVGIYDGLPLINNVIKGISNVKVVTSTEGVVVTFDCAISTAAIGDQVAQVSFTSGDVVVDTKPEFSMDNAEGFYVTASSGVPAKLEDVDVTYYAGDNTLVIDGFAFTPNLPGTLLPIAGVTVEQTDGVTTLTGDAIDVEYSFMGMAATGVVKGLKCEIIEDDAQFVFTISAAMGGGGPASDYPCTYNGDIDVKEGNFAQDRK